VQGAFATKVSGWWRVVGAVLWVLVSAPAHAQNACSRSEQLYGAAKDAGVAINGVYVTLPRAPEWTGLLPLYRLLKDHDPGVNDGDCRKMIRRLKDAVLERVQSHGTFLRVQVDDPLNRLRGDRSVEVDGLATTATRAGAPGADKAVGHPITSGNHTVRLRRLTLQPGERLVVESFLENQSLGKGEASEFRVQIPASLSAGRRTLTLRVSIGVVRECKIRLQVAGNLFDAPKPGEPQFIVELSQTDLVTKQVLQRGDYPLTEGNYTLGVMLQEGQLKGAPRLLLDDAQAGLRPVSGRAVPTWQYALRLECPPDSGYVRTTVELLVPGRKSSSGAAPHRPVTARPEPRPVATSAPSPEPEVKVAKGVPVKSKVVTSEPVAPKRSAQAFHLPTLSWVGIGVAGAGLVGAGVSYFGVGLPNQNKVTALHAERDCDSGSALCDELTQARILRLWDAHNAGRGVAIASAAVGAAGIALAVVAWILDEPTPQKAPVSVQWVPGRAGGGVVSVSGEF
jgi:hypothetical protein